MRDIVKNLAAAVERGCGASVESFGDSFVESSARDFARGMGLSDISCLPAELESCPAKLRKFCESLCVPETWFFRQPESFEFLGEIAEKSAAEGRFLRVLCAPCSIGCEAFSIASVIAAAGADFEIEAFDYSEKLIGAAKRAAYGKNCFRSAASEAAFQIKNGLFEMPDSLKKKIKFAAANILDDDFFPGLFDIIFCRNLAIYLTERSKKKLFDKILSMSAQGAVIFTGHADGFVVSDPRFERAGAEGAFAVRPAIKKSENFFGAFLGENRREQLKKRAKKLNENAIEPAPAAPNPIPEKPDISAAMALADAGNIDSARMECLKMLAEYPDSAELNMLAAEIFSAQGDLEKAEKYFRRARYADPQNADAALGFKLVRRRLEGRS